MPSPDLPDFVNTLFWEYEGDEAAALAWGRDRDFIIGRVLAEGSWPAVAWLRDEIGDAAVRDWIERREGRGLSPRQLRFWETILELPRAQVNRWLAAKRDAPASWANRTAAR